jgi:site-specific DNA recombinase
VWNELYPAEQAHILRLLIERIDVAPDGISVTLHVAGIRSLIAKLRGEGVAEIAVLEAAK